MGVMYYENNVIKLEINKSSGANNYTFWKNFKFAQS